MMRFGVMLLTLMWPAVAQAETQPHVAERLHYMAKITPCLADADRPEQVRACIGSGAEVCMETETDGYSTFGMVACMAAETQVWDDLLNSEYTLLQDRARRMDAAETDDAYAVRDVALLEAQRAWIDFRDAECLLAYSEFGAGSMRRLSGAGCRLHMTAERAIDLHFMFEAM